MSGFSKRIPFLQDLFPASGTQAAQPAELGETVSLIHEWPGRAESLLGMRADQIVSTSVVTPSMTLFANSFGGKLLRDWVEIIEGDISHNSATARTIQFFLQSPGPGAFNTALARWTSMVSVLGAAQPSGFEPIFGVRTVIPAAAPAADWHPLRRPLIIPPGWALLITGDTAAAAYAITFSAVSRAHTPHERPVTI